ncbi:nuclear transport factor 2 family protein [Streptomyces sp. Je 1-79]|uniref:nuclear transport factor 2 family protein n=1 Tax=Streptomyces sp. Je 1-79 TaxID=2943847 RepID=UPI0021A67DF6|nr:nuclear transport factor 2 family protein [Streptomyces sp. Je 1-79]MCT4356200.1 nuclear transport factor 2 family protein [Streptomyces sp. Je 1-79]
MTGTSVPAGLAGTAALVEGSPLADLADRAALGDLAEGYLASLDEGTFDEEWARSFFTEDVELVYPVGSHRGIAGVPGFTRQIMDRWESTHHQGSPSLVVLDGDRATVSWSLIASHLHFDSPRPPAASRYFQLGGRFDASARRTPLGWRFTRMRLRIIWSTGQVPAEVTSVAAETLVPGSGTRTSTRQEGN